MRISALAAVAAAAVVASGLCASEAWAQPVYTWTPTGAGTYAWEAAGSWSGGDPNYIDPNWPGANAVFNPLAGGSQVVQLWGPEAIGRLTLSSSLFYGYSFQGGGLTASSVSIGGGTTIFDNAVTFGSGTIWANLAGAGGLTKNTSGTLVLYGANGYGGGTSVQGGTLLVAAPGSLPLAGGVEALGGSTLAVSAGAAGQWASTDVGALLSTASFHSGASLGINVDSYNSFSYTSGISTAGMGLTKLGGGKLILGGTNTYSGGTTVSAGTLTLGSATALPVGGALTVNGGVLDLGGYTTAALGAVSITGATVKNGTLTSTASYQLSDATVTACLTGSAGLLVTGGTVRLDPAPTAYPAIGNSYTGPTVIQSGTVIEAFPYGLGSHPLVQGGATLAVDLYRAPYDSYSGDLASSLQRFVSEANFQSGASFGIFTDAGYDCSILAGGIYGSCGFIKLGPGSLYSRDGLYFSGGVTINDGLLLSPIKTGPTTLNGGTLLTGPLGGMPSGGALTVNGGLMDLGTNSQTVGAVVITGGTIQNGVLVSSASYQASGGTILANLGGTAGLTVTGGLVTLRGIDGYSGGTTITGGTLLATSSASLPGFGTTGKVTVGPAGTLALSAGGPGQWGSTDVASALSHATFQSGSTFGLNVDTGNSFTLSSSMPASSLGFSKLGGGTLVLGSATVLPSTGTVTMGAGVLDLGAMNTAVGSLTITGGTIQNGSLVGSASFLASGGTINANLCGPAGLTVSGGTVTLGGSNNYAGGTNILSGTLQATTPAAVPFLGSGTVVGSAATLAVSMGGPGQWGSPDLASVLSHASFQSGSTFGINVDPGNTFNYGGGISGAGLSLAKLGAGTLVLSGTNSYGGGTGLDAGTLTLGSSGALPSGGAVTVNGGVLDLGTRGPTVGPVTIADGVIQNGSLFSNSSYRASGGTISANLAGPAGLTVTGGTVMLSGSNSYGGGTNVAGGTLVAMSPAALPGYNTAGAVIVGAGGTLAVSAGGAGQWTPADMGTLLADVGFLNGANFGINVDAGSSFIHPGGISGANLGLAKMGGGTLSLSGTGTYGGGTTLNGGTLLMSSAGALPSNGSITVNDGLLDLGGRTLSAGPVLITGGTIADGNLVSSTSFQASGGAIQANLQGAAGLAVTGGLVTLSGRNTYTGGTQVLGGTLSAIQGNSLPTGTTVSRGATLQVSAGGPGQWGDLSGLLMYTTFEAGSRFAVNVDAGNSFTSTNYFDPAGLVKMGGGTLTVTGGYMPCPGITVNDGTLIVGGPYAIMSADLLTVNGGVFDLGRQTASFDAVTITGGTVQNGWLQSNTVFQLSGGNILANLVGGDLMVTGGTVTLGGGTTNTSGTNVLGGTLLATSPFSQSGRYFGVTVYAGGTLAVSAGRPGQWTAVNVATLLTDANFRSGSVLGVSVDGGRIFNYATAITAAPVAIDKLGDGTLLLGGTNSYGGGTSIDGGTLVAYSSGALPSGGALAVRGGLMDLGAVTRTVGAVSISGGTIQDGNLSSAAGYQASGGTVLSNLAGTGGLTVSGGLVTLAGSNTYSGGTKVLGGALVATRTAALPGYSSPGQVAVCPTGTLAVSAGGAGQWTASDVAAVLSSATFQAGADFGINVDAGNTFAYSSGLSGPTRGFTKLGDGTLLLGGSNTYGGGTTLIAGTLSLTAAGALPSGGALNVNGGLLDLGGFSATVGAVSLSGGTIRGGTLSSAAGYQASGGTVAADLAGAAGLTVTGGTVTLTGTDTYAGGTNVQGGTLLATVPAALPGGGAGTTVRGGATLAVSAGGAGQWTASGLTNLLSVASFQSGSALGINVDAGTSFTYGGGISLPAAGLSKLGDGALVLGGASSYGGATTVSAGTLVLGSADALPTGGDLEVDGGILDLGTYAPTVGAVRVSGGTIQNGGLYATSYQASGGTIGAGLHDGGSSAKMTVTGGLVSLTGVNSYSGGTLVQGGTLRALSPAALPATASRARSRSCQGACWSSSRELPGSGPRPA